MENTSRHLSSRRYFIARTSLAAATMPFIATRSQAASGTGTSSSPAKPSANLAATCIHVFSKPLQAFSYEATAALLSEAGYGGVDFSVRPGGHVTPENVTKDLPRAVEAARKCGLKVEMITTAIVDSKDGATENVLRTAADCGVKYYRLGWLSYDDKLGIWPSLQKVRVQLHELGALNEKLGLHGAYQNHAGARIGGPVWDLYEILRDVDPRWLGCQYDVRHATVEGASSWPLAMKLLAPWIRCTDIKDFKWKQDGKKATVDNVPLGQGAVDFDKYFGLVRQLGIGGPMSVHFEYPPFERTKLGPDLDERRRLFAPLLAQDLQTLRSWMKKHRIA